MTNEEMRRWNFEMRDDGLYFCGGEHDKALGCEFEKLTPELFLSTARSLVSLAYEEAARLAESHSCAQPPRHVCENEIAVRIRALKDSLVRESVSSVS